MRSLFDDVIEDLGSIGVGAQGSIGKYKLVDGSIVAIKTFSPDDRNKDITSESLNELHAYQILKGCPNFVQILDLKIGVEYNETILQIMMPYYTSDLYTFIKTVPFIERIKYSEIIISQLLTGLYQLYNYGIIHRDIKPENILINYEYNKETEQVSSIPQVYIGDFGISIQLPCNKDYRDVSMSTDVYAILYRPPEILANSKNYTEKADIWSLGIVLMEYFLGKDFIKYIQYYNDRETTKNVIYQLLSNLTHPLEPSNPSLLDFDNLNIHDNLNVKTILESNMSRFHSNMIPYNIILLLESMLMVNPNDRPQINELITNVEICKIMNAPLKRGIPLNVDYKTYYYLIKQIIIASANLKLSNRTIIIAIDILDRYLHNYQIQSDDLIINTQGNVIIGKNLTLIVFACLLLSYKRNEIYAPELNDFVYISNNLFTKRELIDVQIVILERMKYLIISCDIDDYVHELNKDPVVNYEQLLTTYLSIAKEQRHASALLYSEIIEYLLITRNTKLQI